MKKLQEIAYTFEQGGLHYVWLYETDKQYGEAHREEHYAKFEVWLINSGVIRLEDGE